MWVRRFCRAHSSTSFARCRSHTPRRRVWKAGAPQQHNAFAEQRWRSGQHGCSGTSGAPAVVDDAHTPRRQCRFSKLSPTRAATTAAATTQTLPSTQSRRHESEAFIALETCVCVLRASNCCALEVCARRLQLFDQAVELWQRQLHRYVPHLAVAIIKGESQLIATR